MIVIRLEVETKSHLGKIGPWCAGIYDKRFEKVCDNYRANFRGYPKEPLEDGCAHFVSCSNMLTGMWGWWQVQHWFTRWAMAELLEAGFKLNVYEVPNDDCFKGETQVVYYPSGAVLVESLTDETIIWNRVWGNRYEKRCKSSD